MRIRHAVTAGAVGLSTVMALGMATPADAVGRRPAEHCTYTVDQTAGTVSGSCSGTVTATFSGSYSDGTASGTFVVDTWLGDIDGTFSGTGFGSGPASGTYTVTTWFGIWSGTFGALPA